MNGRQAPHHLVRFFASLALALVSIAANTVLSQEEPGYVRFVPGAAQWEGELQTAVVSFENDAGVQVNLVAAVHLAEEEYYWALNDFFTTQDVVLYELVAEPDQVPMRDSSEANSSVIGFIQQAMAGFLNIGFQLEEIDYSQPNFLHADLTPTQLAALMASKNESFFTVFINLAKAQIAQQNASPEEPASSFTLLTLLNAVNSQNQNEAIKYLFAEELGRSGGILVTEQLEQQLTLLGDRNQAALRVLGDTLKDPAFKQISIFYGAAHMPGIERELRAGMGFTRTEQRWLSAWVIP